MHVSNERDRVQNSFGLGLPHYIIFFHRKKGIVRKPADEGPFSLAYRPSTKRKGGKGVAVGK